uniref:Liprin-beta-2-like n=1 Tax=Gouania willdenowi TaxID=441366 RepID=A0A8C5E9A6_GOUWI
IVHLVSHMLCFTSNDRLSSKGTKVAALEFSNSLYELGSPVSTGPLQVVQLAEDLKLALDLQPSQEERESLRAQVSTETAQAIMDWLHSGVNLCSPTHNESYQERLLRLEGDKESLVLQVSVLTDQVEAQGEKIRDLESSLEEHRQKLASTGEMLQQELMSRTSLETQKLDLTDEVSFLKLKLVSMEEANANNHVKDPTDRQQNKAEVQLQHLLASKDAEIECLQTQLLTRGGTDSDNAERDQEYQRLKVGMESLLASCDEKDRRIEELTILLGKCRKIKEIMALTQGKYHMNKLRFWDHYFIVICIHKSNWTSFLDFNWIGRPETFDECILSDQSPLSSGIDSGQQSPVSPENRKTQRGIKKLWGKIRRSQSGSPVQFHDTETGEFKRGGFRATAGPRLAHSGKTRNLKIPFCKWSTEQVCDWLDDIGLGQYNILAQHWVTSGQSLLSATAQDLEKELAMKNPLHRKKLQLSIKTISGKQPEKSAELDYLWVTRWLDDIGLPQYKDQFNDGRVDGPMLQYLTVNDLLFLKVTSQLHHLSIKCAIHVLHVNKFDPNCLKRRPGNEVLLFSPSEVVQWSNHRVMEWLRSVDLAEYAPNLRGSGVHGGLIMLEPRFNADSLAMLLNIPPQKTLLRRHLSTNFNSLVGSQAQQEKREYTEVVGYTPLSITAKVKPKRLGFSHLTHLRRRRSDESTDYVCPIDSPSPQSGQPMVNGVQMRPYSGFRGLSPILDREPERSTEQVGLQDSRADSPQ